MGTNLFTTVRPPWTLPWLNYNPSQLSGLIPYDLASAAKQQPNSHRYNLLIRWLHDTVYNIHYSFTDMKLASSCETQPHQCTTSSGIEITPLLDKRKLLPWDASLQEWVKRLSVATLVNVCASVSMGHGRYILIEVWGGQLYTHNLYT